MLRTGRESGLWMKTFMLKKQVIMMPVQAIVLVEKLHAMLKCRRPTKMEKISRNSNRREKPTTQTRCERRSMRTNLPHVWTYRTFAITRMIMLTRIEMIRTQPPSWMPGVTILTRTISVIFPRPGLRLRRSRRYRTLIGWNWKRKWHQLSNPSTRSASNKIELLLLELGRCGTWRRSEKYICYRHLWKVIISILY